MITSKNLPEDFRKRHGLRLVSISIRLKIGGTPEIDRREMTVKTHVCWGPGGKFTNGVGIAGGCDFVAGDNSLSSKNMYGCGLEDVEFNPLGGRLSHISVYGYCAVEDEAACTALLFDMLFADVARIKIGLSKELAGWSACTLTLPAPETSFIDLPALHAQSIAEIAIRFRKDPRCQPCP